jgi:uncharacterized membrane protein YgcG
MKPANRYSVKSFGLVLLAAIAAGLATATQADERILDYHSDIEIRADGSMNVTETIRVRAEGDQIRRGIYRDFPTVYRDRWRIRHVVDFDLIAIRRDGAPEPYFTDARPNGVRVYIGDANRTLPPGEYEYTIEYDTDWQLGLFQSHDELWWNVNGNDWGFPVDRISASITLPAPVGIDKLTIEGWVGAYRSQEQSVTTEITSGLSAGIAASRSLDAYEGLSFAMTWPKGIVAEPTPREFALRLLDNNRGILVALLGLAAGLFYWLYVWRAHGRDPERGTIFPHYEPPPGVSPASARHIRRMGYDQKAFSAAIINLAVKGYLEIDEDGGDYSLRRIEGSNDEPLAPGEAALMRELFVRGDLLSLENANHATLQAAMSAQKQLLKRDNDVIHFKTNGIYVLPAIVILAISFLLIIAVNGLSPVSIAISIMSLVLVPVFAFLMRAHTPAGRRLLDKIEGFRLYLDVAEKDALNRTITPEVFETFLPYALALDVEQRWGERFNASLSTEQAAAYQPTWYHGQWTTGRGGFGGNIGAATAAVTGAVAGSIAAAATPPGSSSGSGGGGFSGGGGGGGGGGGW